MRKRKVTIFNDGEGDPSSSSHMSQRSVSSRINERSRVFLCCRYFLRSNPVRIPHIFGPNRLSCTWSV